MGTIGLLRRQVGGGPWQWPGRLARELCEAREELVRKELLIRDLEHDLRNSLGVALSQAYVAERALEGDGVGPAQVEATRCSLGAIRRGLWSADELLASLLEVGRVEEAAGKGRCGRKADAFDLAESIRRVADGLRPEAEAKGLVLRIDLELDVPVLLDRLALGRLLANLLGNAIKFTGEGGVRVKMEAHGCDATILVADTGVGIAPERLGSLFDDYTRGPAAGDSEREGFGLGLPIARRLAKALGGSLAVESRVGVGSRFTLTLPGIVTEAAGPASSLS